MAGAIFSAALICLFLAELIRGALPYILGGILLILGIDGLYESLKDKTFDKEDTDRIASSIGFLILALVVLFRRDESDILIGAIWGIVGLVLGGSNISHSLHGLIHRDGKEAGHVIHLVQALLSVGISIALLLDPAHHLEFHVYILGLELTDFAIKVAFDEI